MNNDLLSLAEEAIKIEKNVSNLYLIFHEAFAEDANFWWKLVIEEENHAALIKSGIEYFEDLGLFPKEILPNSLQELVDANKKLVSLIEEYSKQPPSRSKAFQVALETEKSAGEIHLLRAMESPAKSKIMKIFQKLNENDKYHIERIQAYMDENLS